MQCNLGYIHTLRICSIAQLKRDGTRWRTVGEIKGKHASAVGSQYLSHYLATWCIQHYYRWCAHLGWPAVDWTDAPADLNGIVLFAEERNVISARVPSHSTEKNICRKAHHCFVYTYIFCLVIYVNKRFLSISLYFIYPFSMGPVRSQWSRRLRRGSAAARLLGLRVRIPPGALMSVCCECCVLSSRYLCDGPIARQEESYCVWPV